MTAPPSKPKLQTTEYESLDAGVPRPNGSAPEPDWDAEQLPPDPEVATWLDGLDALAAGGDVAPASDFPSDAPGNPGKSGNGEWWDSAITAADLDRIDYPPPAYLVDGIIPAGGLVLVPGAPKSGKTYLCLDVALAVAQGGNALGRADALRAGNVLYVSLDDQSRARIQHRLRDINSRQPLPDTLTIHTEANLGQGKDAAARLDHYLTRHPETALVVIDTKEHLRPDPKGGASAYTADVRFLAQLRWVADRHTSATIMLLTHTRKAKGLYDEDDPVAAVTGTHGVTGGADHLVVLTGKRGNPRRVLTIVSRDGADRECVLLFTSKGLTLTDEDPNDPAVRLTPDDLRVVRALASYGDSGATAVELEPDLDGMPKVGNRLASLADRGYARKLQRGRYAATTLR